MGQVSYYAQYICVSSITEYTREKGGTGVVSYLVYLRVSSFVEYSREEEGGTGVRIVFIIIMFTCLGMLYLSKY